jgi:hypothetical protein
MQTGQMVGAGEKTRTNIFVLNVENNWQSDS